MWLEQRIPIRPSRLHKAAYWKNGQLSELENAGVSHINGITVDGADVYCTGSFEDYFIASQRDSAAYWKNGTRNTLTALSKGAGTAIHLFGSTLYIAGYIFDDVSSFRRSLEKRYSKWVWRPDIYCGYGRFTG